MTLKVSDNQYGRLS